MTLPFLKDQAEQTPPSIYNYAALDKELAVAALKAAKRIRSKQAFMTASMLDIGRELLAIRDKLPHGEWKKWIEAEFVFSERTAYNYMDAAKLQCKVANVAVLPLTAIYALAEASTAPEVVAKISSFIAAGNIPSALSIKDEIEKHKPAAPQKTKPKKGPSQLAVISPTANVMSSSAYSPETTGKAPADDPAEDAANAALSMAKEALGSAFPKFAALLQGAAGNVFITMLKEVA